MPAVGGAASKPGLRLPNAVPVYGSTRGCRPYHDPWYGVSPQMANEAQPLIRLVAAVIERDGRYLITQRRASAVLPGLWEFPGGRVEDGTQVEVKTRMAHRVHHYDGYSVDLNLFQAAIAPGQEPQAVRVAEIRWVPSNEFEKYPFPAADQATTDLLLGFRR
jgi:8-oxo-dGTP diphosphatase